MKKITITKIIISEDSYDKAVRITFTRTNSNQEDDEPLLYEYDISGNMFGRH